MNDINILKAQGIDADSALQILGDINLYRDTIQTFINESDENLRNIIRYKQANDIKGYGILVHSLMSSAKYLGFVRLNAILTQHELASVQGNTDYINANFNMLIDEFNRVLFACKQYIGVPLKKENKSSILVVDDSSIIRNFVKKIFKDEYEVLTAENGNDAINTVNKMKVDMMLLDLNMPECNGFVVLEYFKQNNLFKTIPVALLTGDDTKDSISKAFNYPIIDMVSKPFNESDIKAIVDKMRSVHKFN